VARSSLLRWRRLQRVCALEKPAASEEARWRGRKTGYHALARRRCQQAEWRRDEVGGALESAATEAAQWSAVAESCHGTAVR
jgi:hypothetical protein